LAIPHPVISHLINQSNLPQQQQHKTVATCLLILHGFTRSLVAEAT